MMEIIKADIHDIRTGSFEAVYNDGIKQVKVLSVLSIVQATEGSYDIALGSDAISHCPTGCFFIAPSNVQQTIVHHVDAISRKMSARWLFLTVKINNAYQLDSLYKFPTVINSKHKEDLNNLFNPLFKTNNIFEKYSLCYKILEKLIDMAIPIFSNTNQLLSNSVVYMTENYHKHISIDELAQIAYMSKPNFYTAFKKQFGNSPIAYLNHYRLSIASEKLIETNIPINEICRTVGINDSLYFSKIFKKTYGISPKEYRNTYGKTMRDYT